MMINCLPANRARKVFHGDCYFQQHGGEFAEYRVGHFVPFRIILICTCSHGLELALDELRGEMGEFDVR